MQNKWSEFRLELYHLFIDISFIALLFLRYFCVQGFPWNLLSYGSEAKSSHLKSAFYYKDTLRFEDANTKAANGGKTSYMVKQNLIKGSKIINFSMQVFCDFLNTKRLLPPGNTIKLRFIRNDDDFSIIAATRK